MNMEKHVWYCSYGSNLLIERFRLYIEGGTADFIDRDFKGCNDKTMPVIDEGYLIPHELYFSKKAKQWENKGVAFIESNPNKEAKTYCRIYKVTLEQFIEIVQQENGQDPDVSKLDIDFDKLMDEKSIILPQYENLGWYPKLLLVGFKNEIPILTFTSNWVKEEITYSKPGAKYLNVIANGIKESFNISDDSVMEYFLNKNGIKELYKKTELEDLLKK